MSRQPPQRTPEQQQEFERREALINLDVGKLRAWMERYGMGASGDDDLVLRAAHEVRVIDPRLPKYAQRISVAWLRAHYPQSTVLQALERFPTEFRAPNNKRQPRAPRSS